MAKSKTFPKHIGALLLITLSAYLSFVFRIRHRPAEEHKTSSDSEVHVDSTSNRNDRDESAYEPYKIAIGAFYAICVQRVFETTIASLDKSAPKIEISAHHISVSCGSGQIVLLCQLLAYVVWLGLYYISNVRLYFRTSDYDSSRRAVIHVTLTTALGLFYFLAATIGDPGVTQLLLILGILLVDTIFPVVIGRVLERKATILWVVRGTLQSGFVVLILLFVSPASYKRVAWSASMLLLMLIQLVLIAPIESSWRSRKSSAQDHFPNG